MFKIKKIDHIHFTDGEMEALDYYKISLLEFDSVILLVLSGVFLTWDILRFLR